MRKQFYLGIFPILAAAAILLNCVGIAVGATIQHYQYPYSWFPSGHYLTLDKGGYVDKTTETPWNTWTVPLFDPSWGTLMQVDVSISGYVSIGGGYASKWGSGDYVEWSQQIDVVLGDMVFDVSNIVEDSGTIPDWSQVSAQGYWSSNQSFTTSDPGDLALYTGVGSYPLSGSITFTTTLDVGPNFSGTADNSPNYYWVNSD
jgi:hypothetical protein